VTRGASFYAPTPSRHWTLMLSRELIRKVRRIELVTRRLVNPQLSGQYHSVFKGRGMDFDEVQAYADGDDVRFIDWNVTARSESLWVKRFVEERELTVQLVIDASSSMTLGTAATTKRDTVTLVASVLAMLATRNNDRVGAVLFDEKVTRHVPPRKGRKHMMQLATLILDHPSSGNATGLAEALEYVRRVQTRRAIVFVLSDFQSEGWELPLKLLARRHDVVPVRIVDPLEEAPPEPQEGAGLWHRLREWWLTGGVVEVEDLEDASCAALDLRSAKTRRNWREVARARRQIEDGIFLRLRLDTIEFRTDFVSETDYVQPLATFFRRRARRA
jgi:uncharacterized protein (DUF58 family)